MVKLSFLQLRVTNVKLKIYQITFKISYWKTEKKKILYTLYYTLHIYKQKGAYKIALLRLCDLLITHSDFKPMDLYLRELKSGINFALEPEWAYIRLGLYSSFYGN